MPERRPGSENSTTPEERGETPDNGIDFNNIDLLDEVLANENDPRVPQLKIWLEKRGVNGQDYQRAMASQKLRNTVHEKQWADLRKREKENPVPTEDELSMGAFMEIIEPQVRRAALMMREKGYDTTSSGFDTFDHQAIYFSKKYFADLPPDVREALASLGVSVRPSSLSFRAEKADMEELKKKWDAIAALLPDLGQPAPPTSHPQAKYFRKKFGPKDQ